MQESLAQIGIKARLNKIPGANWRAEFSKKALPFITNVFGGWLNYPEYFFYWTYHGQNAIFNTMSYQNPAMDKLIDAARFETDPRKYKDEVEGFISIAFDGGAAHPALPAVSRRGDAEEHRRIPLLVPSPARLPPAE